MEAHLHALILASACRSTHHYIVMDALEHLSGPDAPLWRRLLLHHHTALLRGAKAPDTQFKDFKNHVLHVGEDSEWGGARGAATDWYGRAVKALRERNWAGSAYALGVLSHYYTDPLQPLHTGQTEAEGAVHRALEWSVFKSRSALKARMDALPAPQINAREDTNFVSELVADGARLAHPHYQALVDEYDLDAGVKRPEQGLPGPLLERIAALLAHAAAGTALLFERAFAEADVSPKPVQLTLDAALAHMKRPVGAVLAKIEASESRRAIARAHREFLARGKVIDALPRDEATVRALHAAQVLQVDLAELDASPAEARKALAPEPDVEPVLVSDEPAPIEDTEDAELEMAPAVEAAEPEPPPEMDAPEPATETEPAEPEPVFDGDAPAPEETPAPLPALTEPAQHNPEPSEPAASAAPADVFETPRGRGGLSGDSDVIDAPSIGKRTARHLRRAGVHTIDDLLKADAEALARDIPHRHITPATIRDWQDQTRLKCALPSLRVHDVQILVGAGIRSIEALRSARAGDLFAAAARFAATPSAERIIHDADKPTRDEVDTWISKARRRAG